MIDHERAFRDYVTRVSFNLSMSRNQVATLRSIVLDMEAFDASIPYSQRHPGSDYRNTEIKEARANGFRVADMFIPGLRYLLATGIIVETPQWQKENAREDEFKAAHPTRTFRRNWGIPHYRLTPAGECVVGLLRIAGLIPMPAANVNRTKRRRSA